MNIINFNLIKIFTSIVIILIFLFILINVTIYNNIVLIYCDNNSM